jgi:hypothetical protein
MAPCLADGLLAHADIPMSAAAASTSCFTVRSQKEVWSSLVDRRETLRKILATLDFRTKQNAGP